MTDHCWIIEVIQDIEEYALSNGLTHTAERARSVLGAAKMEIASVRRQSIRVISSTRAAHSLQILPMELSYPPKN
jgi:hypothetical protein